MNFRGRTLGVIPGGVGMLDHVLTLAWPGGVVFLEEADIGTLICVPGHRAWDRAVDAMARVFDQVGADLELGRKLFALLRRGGLGELRVRPCVHALRAGQPMMLHIPATLEVMRGSVLSMGLMSAPELDQVLADLRRHLSAPETLTISYAMIQVTGRVPGPYTKSR